MLEKTIHNFVFDFGDVIFEWNPVKRVEEHFKGDWHGHLSAEDLARNIFGSKTWHDFDKGVLSMDAVIEQSANRLTIDRNQLQSLIQPIGEELVPVQASIRCLESLVQKRAANSLIRLFYLSNIPEPYARSLESRHAFLKWFDAGIFSADVKQAKPDLKIYQLLSETHSLDPENTLFIDDQLLNTQAAQSMGWSAIHLESPELLSEKLSDFMTYKRV